MRTKRLGMWLTHIYIRSHKPKFFIKNFKNNSDKFVPKIHNRNENNFKLK